MPPAPASPSQTAHAVLLMLIATFSFAAMGALVRIASAELHSFEIVFFRNLFALLALAPLLWRLGPGLLRTERLSLHLTRGALGFAAMSALFAALALIPLAEATALTFSAPLFATICAVLLLGERIRAHRTAALILGFLGVLVVLQPGVAAVSPWAALALIGAALVGLLAVLVKKLTHTDRPESIALWAALVMTPLSLPPALLVWRWPSPEIWAALIAIGLSGALAQLAWTRASALGEVTLLQPIEFVRLPFVAAAGYWLFGETPTVWTWIGGGVIVVSTAYIAFREARLARAPAPPPRPTAATGAAQEGTQRHGSVP